MELSNCPEIYSLNCKRYEVACHKCKANDTGKYLQYLPIDKSIQNHPANIKQKKKGHASNATKGRKQELKVIKTFDSLERTYASGSVGADGDARIQVNNYLTIRTEIKTRLSNFEKKFVPTSKEIKEGRQQNVEAWVICDSGSNVYLYMDYKVFMSVYRRLILHPDSQILEHVFKIHHHSNKRDVIRAIPNYALAWKTNRGFKPLNFTTKHMGSFNVITNPHGRFVCCMYELFESLISCYKMLNID